MGTAGQEGGGHGRDQQQAPSNTTIRRYVHRLRNTSYDTAVHSVLEGGECILVGTVLAVARPRDSVDKRLYVVATRAKVPINPALIRHRGFHVPPLEYTDLSPDGNNVPRLTRRANEVVGVA